MQATPDAQQSARLQPNSGSSAAIDPELLAGSVSVCALASGARARRRENFSVSRRGDECRNLPEHLGAKREDEGEAIVAGHPADGNPDKIPFLIEYTSAGHSGMTISETCHETIRRALADVAGAQDDAFGIIVPIRKIGSANW